MVKNLLGHSSSISKSKQKFPMFSVGESCLVTPTTVKNCYNLNMVTPSFSNN